MPTTIFDWMVRTAMLAMAGLVTLSILGAIATMTNDSGMRFAGADRPVIEGERAQDREAAQAPSSPEEGNSTSATMPGTGREAATSAVTPPPEDKIARWLEAIAYALLAIVGIGALGLLMLWSILRELQRSRRSPR